MPTRANAILVGVGLAILWIAGLATHATAWLSWLNGAAAMASFALAAAVPTEAALNDRSIPALMVTAGLFALWIVALALHATVWLTWLTFVAGCCYAVIGASLQSAHHAHHSHLSREV